MRIADRYDAAITRARISRTAKNKALVAKCSGNKGYSTSRASGSTVSKNTVTQMLLEQLKGSNSTAQTAEKLAEYRSRIYDYGVINVAAERVEKQLGQLLQTGENSLFAKAEESGDYSEIGKGLSSFVGDYNLMLRKLKESSDSADAAYLKQLKTEMNKRYSALKELGITSDTNGLLTFDEKAFEAADKTKLKELFGTSGGLAESIKKLAGDIEKYTLQQQKTLQEKMYAGSSNYSKYGMSDLDSWGTGSSYNAKG